MPRALSVCLIVGMVFVGPETPLRAQGTYTLKICNTGAAPIWIAYLADTGIGLFAAALGAASAVAAGWYEVGGEECRDFTFERLDRARQVWLAFTARDARGNWVSIPAEPTGSVRLSVANTYLCVDGNAPLDRRADTYAEAQRCGPTVTRPINVPLTVLLTIPGSTTGSLTFRLNARPPFGQVLSEVIPATTTDDNAARIALANSHFDAGRYPEARTLYLEALQRAPRNTAVSTDLAVCYYQLGEIGLALKQVDYSLSLEPSNTKALFNKGLFLAYGMNDWPAARNLFRQVISIAPQSAEGVQARKVLDAAGPQ